MKPPADLANELRARLVDAIAALERVADHLPADAARLVDEAHARQIDLMHALDEATAVVRRSAPGGASVEPTDASVLLVGGDETRRTVAAVLTPHFQVREAHGSADARAAIVRHPPDVILADADEGGAALCRLLKRDRALAPIPFVLLTGMPVREVLENGADDVVVEPFHAEELVSRLRNLVALRQKERMLVATLDELREAKRSLDEDLQQARSLQLALLPRSGGTRELRFEAVYRPADLVGGDLCDVHVTGRRHRFFLADTTGHGLRASLQTMVVKTAWDRHKAAASGPGDALARLNEEILSLDPSLQTRLVAACFDLDLDARRLVYATAAHLPMLLVRDGVRHDLWQPGTFVGLVRGVSYDEAELPLEPGDRVIAFSDGLVEQFTANGDRVDEEAIFGALTQPGTLADVLMLTFRFLERVTGGAPPPDDVTLLAVEVAR